MNIVDNIMKLVADNFQATTYGATDTLRTAIEQSLTPGETAPSDDDVRLAEMILSDCGHSTNNTRLLERVTNRIARHTAPQPQRNWISLTEEQRDALIDARNEAMEWSLKERIPECGAFAGIAQNLDWLCIQLGSEQSR